MSLQIKRYCPTDEAALYELMRPDDWMDYAGDAVAFEKYKMALNDCIVYVAHDNGVLCGFLRARDDYSYGIYIYDLLVDKAYRGIPTGGF